MHLNKYLEPLILVFDFTRSSHNTINFGNILMAVKCKFILYKLISKLANIIQDI